MEREVHSILGPIGVKEGLSRLIANDLRTVEEESLENASKMKSGSSGSWWKIWKKTGGIRLEEEGGTPENDGEMGLTAFLLKFGEGMGAYSLFWIYEENIADNCRGGPYIPTIYLSPNHRSLLLLRWPHPTPSIPVRHLG
jgi:hypothetical protein